MFNQKTPKVSDERFAALFNRKLRILAQMLPYVISFQAESIQAGCNAFKEAQKPMWMDYEHWEDNTANLLASNSLTIKELQFLTSFVKRLEDAISEMQVQTILDTGDLVDKEFEAFSKELGLGSMGYKNPHYGSFSILQLLWSHAYEDAKFVS